MLELVLAVEAAAGRGKAVLLIHDATKALEANDLSVKAYVLSEAARGVSQGGKWDGAAYVYFCFYPFMFQAERFCFYEPCGD